jgi:hypothetical protein
MSEDIKKIHHVEMTFDHTISHLIYKRSQIQTTLRLLILQR